MDYKDSIYKKEIEQHEKQKQLIVKRPQPGFVINNYNSTDSTDTQQCDSMCQTHELVPIYSLTSTP